MVTSSFIENQVKHEKPIVFINSKIVFGKPTCTFSTVSYLGMTARKWITSYNFKESRFNTSMAEVNLVINSFIFKSLIILQTFTFTFAVQDIERKHARKN